MSDKFSLIRGVEEQARTPKTKYQVFEIRLNTDILNAAIPFDNANLFLENVNKVMPTSKTILVELVEKYAGEIQ